MKTRTRIEIEVEIEFSPIKGDSATGGNDGISLEGVWAVNSKLPFVPPICIVDVLDYDEGEKLKDICWASVHKLTKAQEIEKALGRKIW